MVYKQIHFLFLYLLVQMYANKKYNLKCKVMSIIAYNKAKS